MIHLSKHSKYIRTVSPIHRGVISYLSSSTDSLPSHARVCIIGGGIIGCSVAYHLAKLGWTDVVVLERGRLSCGTTWHAAGLIGQLRDTETETKLSGVYGTQFLQQLERETDQSTGYKACGSLTLATCPDRLTQLKIRANKARAFGIDSEIISPREAREKFPYLYIDDVTAALWLPGDGTAISSDITQALAKATKAHTDASGNRVRFYEQCNVTNVHIHSNECSKGHSSARVKSIETNRGTVNCEVVVNCGGLWARQIGALCGVSVPLASAEHFYVYTKPLPDPVDSMLPILRDPDRYIYYREWSGGLLMGGFEPVAKPAFSGKQGPPSDFEFALLPEDWDHFEILMNGALHRTPVLGDAQVKMINGPESFTPDNQYILGESPEVKGFYVAAGFNSSGIASSGGAGKALAEWIVNDGPTLDLWAVDIRRFTGKVHNNSSFLSSRVSETLGLHYQITWPKRELQSGRPFRISPLYNVHKQNRACFGSKFGWERANFYDSLDLHPNAQTHDVHISPVPMEPYSYGRQWWFENVGQEHNACRSSVALFDTTSFCKLLLQGPGALSALQSLCVSNMDVPVNKIVYTSMCNENGGIESDLTVCRLSSDEFLITTSTAQACRDSHWIRSHLSNHHTDTLNSFAILTDVTSSEAVLSMMGPLSRDLLSVATSADISHESFPFGFSRIIDIGLVNVRAHRISYMGELGYEIYIPTESAISVYKSLHEASKNSGIPLRDAGYFAIDSLRLEKGYRAWGHDITPSDTPLEAGLGFAIDFTKDNFLGKSALSVQKSTGVTRRLVSVVFEAENEERKQPFPYGGEPLFRDGVLVGHLTSASYGYTLRRAVGLAYISSKRYQKLNDKQPIVDSKFIKSGNYEVHLCDGRYKVNVMLQSPYDPSGSRMNC